MSLFGSLFMGRGRVRAAERRPDRLMRWSGWGNLGGVRIIHIRFRLRYLDAESL